MVGTRGRPGIGARGAAAWLKMYVAEIGATDLLAVEGPLSLRQLRGRHAA